MGRGDLGSLVFAWERDVGTCQDLVPSRKVFNFADAVRYAAEGFVGEIFVVSVNGSDPFFLSCYTTCTSSVPSLN